jgi:hypothetical protein
MKRSARVVTPVLILWLSFGGCARTQADLNVTYDDSKVNKGPLSAIPPLRAEIGEFRDARPERNKIGDKRNRLGVKTADIVTTKPVPDIVRDALVAELSRNGHLISAEQTQVIMVGEVTAFWFDYQVNFWTIDFMGTVGLTLNVIDGRTGAVLTRRYQGHYTEASFGGLDATWERVMNTALARVIQEIGTDPHLLQALKARSAPVATGSE